MQIIPGALMPFFQKHQDILIHSYLTHDISVMSIAQYAFPVAVIIAFVCLIFIKETNCKPVALSQKIKMPKRAVS